MSKEDGHCGDCMSVGCTRDHCNCCDGGRKAKPSNELRGTSGVNSQSPHLATGEYQKSELEESSQ